MRRLLVIQVAALGWELLRRNGCEQLAGLRPAPARSVFPALTCAVQGSFRTAEPPARHGMVANGLYCRRLHRTMFWEQSADLVHGRRIWEDFRQRGGRVGMMFWQQSLGESVDLVLSPAPIHRHHGGLIQDCYCRPAGLYALLRRAVGRRFNLMRYWGPLASARVGDWIAEATCAVLGEPALAPHLLMVYLPSLDYDLQRWGPQHEKSTRALARTLGQLRKMIDAATGHGYEVLVFGDYAIGPVSRAVLPNLALRQAGLMRTRTVAGMLYPDFHAGGAFAMADHEIAHVYVRDPGDIPAARQVLEALPGVAEVFGPADRTAAPAAEADHANSGELLVVAEEGSWLAYPWWTGRREAPDYARGVDIHNKPGYDPCELFFGWPPPSVSTNTDRIRGSHGRPGPGREIAWASTIQDIRDIGSLLDLAAAVRDWLAQ